jgi:hypothetical protein
VLGDPVRFDALGADPDPLHTLSRVDPNLLEVGKPGLAGLVLGMGDIMPCLRAFSTNITTS